ncbi:UAA transporter [Schizopora paradoxa]|uniref:UAA transporter n=1 Tax=Schizopora paradoxa TaxID=27342 RepID=A0A0H2RLD2_9AGAM|nr:UAA transporter [Schizopora paradoxa]
MVASNSKEAYSSRGARRRKRESSKRDRGRGATALSTGKIDGLPSSTSVLYDASDVVLALGLVFGGCCMNVWSFEELLTSSHGVGSAITFCQMLFITCQSAPHALSIRLPSPKKWLSFEVKSRRVPLRKWFMQVLVLLGGTLLNNWSFAYNVPITLQIVIRSSGLPVSLVLGRFLLKKTYTWLQISSVGFVTLGAILATTSRSADGNISAGANRFIGLLMLFASLLLTGILGVLQEITFREYGPCWQESIFYTHALSLPAFIFLYKDIRLGFASLWHPRELENGSSREMIVLAVNVFTQFVCVTGVNQLSAHVTSVTKNVVLTSRKALSLCLSVWLFGSDWNPGILLGATMVFTGSISYAFVTREKL